MPTSTKKRGWRAAQSREANFLCLLRRYKRSARTRNHTFSLSPERFRELVTSPCLVCGQKPTQKYVHTRGRKGYVTPFIYNGIDRLDNKKGYIEGNVAPCCRSCNYAKKDLSLEQFLRYIYRAYHHAILPALQEGIPDDED